MAQADYVVANGTGAAVRSDLNGQLAAIVSNNSGATEPATMYAYQWWADTTTGLLKLRNSANSAWITMRQLDGEFSTVPVENGSAAAPSIYFKDSGTDSGFFSPGTDAVAISTAGTNRLHITSAGLVGIGTSSVSALLHAKGAGGSTSGSELLRLETTQATGGNWISFTDASARKGYIGYKETADDNFYIENEESGHVVIPGTTRLGIGTTSPKRLLHLNGGSETVKIQITNTSTGSSDDGDGFQLGIATDGTAGIEQRENADLTFSTNNTEAARIDSSRRLLVGTSTASLSQQIESASTGGNNLGVIRYNSGSGGSEVVLAHSSSDSIGTNNVVHNGDRLGDILFKGGDGTNYIEAASISAQVDGTPGTNDMPGRLTFSTTADGASSPTERLRINSSGKLGTFAAASSDAMQISSGQSAGTSYEFLRGMHSGTAIYDGTLAFRVFTNGNVENTNDSYGQISDVKLKENIVDAPSQWNDFKAVRFRKYNFKEQTGHETHTQLGVIAQELELTSPGLVYETADKDEDGNDLGTTTKAVKSSILTKKALVALQEAMERIETLETEVAALKGA